MEYIDLNPTLIQHVIEDFSTSLKMFHYFLKIKNNFMK